MNLKETREQGFSFGKINPSIDLVNALYYARFDASKEDDPTKAKQFGELRIPDKSVINSELKSLLFEICDDEETFEAISRMSFTANKTCIGDFINLHKDKPNHSREYPHLNIWIPISDYEGREFIYGKWNNFKRLKPRFGDCVLVSNLLDGYLHAVSPMISDSEVISVNGYQQFPGEEMPHEVIYYKTEWDKL